jgi:hypothetical protein
MKKVIRLTEGDLIRIVRRVVQEEEERPIQMKRRFRMISNDIHELIDKAKEELDEDDFEDEFDYLDNVVYYVVQELQGMYGELDDFWFDEEDDIVDFIKDEYDDYLFG